MPVTSMKKHLKEKQPAGHKIVTVTVTSMEKHLKEKQLGDRVADIAGHKIVTSLLVTVTSM